MEEPCELDGLNLSPQHHLFHPVLYVVYGVLTGIVKQFYVRVYQMVEFVLQELGAFGSKADLEGSNVGTVDILLQEQDTGPVGVPPPDTAFGPDRSSGGIVALSMSIVGVGAKASEEESPRSFSANFS